jgi:hypothetical protein
VNSFAAQGTPIDILQIGNEINKYAQIYGHSSFTAIDALDAHSGLMWPYGTNSS